ncbi:GerW family sporulation protein [Alicyclobacillus shizuokensis]|uniref:GerW family sporulation protein n=1 Tax=Alicyclobacillus shizuokensis TaxID=392014 RepID=UPI00082D26C6|nr:GerW family sporulation protein [Alicyclobacillus shizuokensis]MCL6626224.1 GerW family sporulation protein [Alicyclobacillus shizuokensis]
MEHPIQGLMQTAMSSIREMVDVNTIIGDPIEAPDGTVILPVSRVGFGFAAGGSEFGSSGRDASTTQEHPFGGGSGGGVSITPIGFLIVHGEHVRLLSADHENQLYDRLIDMAPQVMEKIQHLFQGGKTKSEVQQDSRVESSGLS